MEGRFKGSNTTTCIGLRCRRAQTNQRDHSTDKGAGFEHFQGFILPAPSTTNAIRVCVEQTGPYDYQDGCVGRVMLDVLCMQSLPVTAGSPHQTCTSEMHDVLRFWETSTTKPVWHHVV